MMCPRCANECHETDKFCLRCGTFLSVQEGTYAAAPMFESVASQPAAMTGQGAAVSPAPIPSSLDNPSSSYANEAYPIKPAPYAGLMALLLAAIVLFFNRAFLPCPRVEDAFCRKGFVARSTVSRSVRCFLLVCSEKKQRNHIESRKQRTSLLNSCFNLHLHHVLFCGSWDGSPIRFQTRRVCCIDE